ncbi:MAG TPA: hypothetical protein VF808_10575 [Ktedonobacterales bacterium]
MTATQRNKLATQGIAANLGIRDDVGQKLAITAALEAVNERLASEPDLREAVRQKYEELVALSTTQQKPDLGPAPVPVRSGTPEQYSPYGKFDPYKLLWEYEAHQLRAALVRGTQRDLREAVGIVQARHPNTAPKSKTSKLDMVDYIMEYVVGPGH